MEVKVAVWCWGKQQREAGKANMRWARKNERDGSCVRHGECGGRKGVCGGGGERDNKLSSHVKK